MKHDQRTSTTITVQRPQDGDNILQIAPPEGGKWTMVNATGYVAGQLANGLPEGTVLTIRVTVIEPPHADPLREAVNAYVLGSWADPAKMFADLAPRFPEADHARLRELIAARAKEHDASLE